MSIESLIDLYGNDVLRLCIAYLGDRLLAEDAFQETFFKAWKSHETFRGESSERTWLCCIAVNVCRDMLRSNWFRMLRRSRPFEELAEIPEPECEWIESNVRTAVLNLPGRYREIILLYYDQNMTIREISNLLKIPQNTVSTRLRRARKQLEKALKGEIEL